MNFRLQKLGTAGAVIAALFCPVCFPKLALVGAALGFGALAPFEGWFVAAVQVFLVLALFGHVVAYRRHRHPVPLVVAAAGVLVVVLSLWVYYVEALVYAGLLAVVAATLWCIVSPRQAGAASGGRRRDSTAS